MSATVPSPGFSEFDDSSRPTSASAQDRSAFGQFLAAARQRSNQSIEDVAAITKVKPRLLEALERGDIEELPAGVYRRAMVKSYASAVGLRPDDAIERFDRTFYPPPPVVEEQPRASSPRPEAGPRVPAQPAAARSEPRRPAQARLRLPAKALAAGLTIVGVGVAVLLWSLSDQAPAAAPAASDALADPQAGSVTGTTASAGAERSGDVFLTPDPIEPSADSIVAPHLVITSRPSGARVTVDGIGWGVTPLRIRNLPPGVKVIRATKDGYVGRETSVRFGMTGDHATVSLTLRPLN